MMEIGTGTGIGGGGGDDDFLWMTIEHDPFLVFSFPFFFSDETILEQDWR